MTKTSWPALTAWRPGAGYPVDAAALLPAVLPAGGRKPGTLTPEGARLLDPTGTLQPGCPLCPPEGDAGTGMAATDSVAPRTGNVSAGTSIFAMVVLERPLRRVYPRDRPGHDAGRSRRWPWCTATTARAT